MLTAIILVCHLATIPDIRNCNASNATHVMHSPETFGSPFLCFKHGQALLAETEIGRTIAEGEIVKVSCVRTQSVNRRIG
jgi:hypothetical protein